MLGNNPTRGSQRGAVLIVALVLLLVLTVLGTASIRDTTMEERMAGNYRDYSAALEAAESALRIGEGAINNTTIFSAMLFDSSDGTHSAATLSVDPETAANYQLSVTDTVLKPGGQAGNPLLVDALPEYFIERLPEIAMPGSDLGMGTQNQAPRVQYYRITAKGYGISPNSEVILQSTYFR